MVAPETIAKEIRSRARDSQALRVFWVTVSGDRDTFAGELKRLLESCPVVPVALRGRGFENPDSVMRDVADVLEGVRGEIQKMDHVIKGRRGVDLVLLSRKDLMIDTSSPIVLPNWFPVAPEHTVTVRIVDLTWSAEAAVSDSSLALEDLRRILHDLDKALVERLQETLKHDHRKSQSLWSHIRVKSDDRMAIELDRIKGALDAVRNPTGYRPSTSKRPTVVGLIWACANKNAPDSLPKVASALAQALNLGDVSTDDMSLIAVLNRPVNPIFDPRARWSFCLIVTLRGACQLVTAAAHADDYPRFPAALLKSTSLDVRLFLDAAVSRLRSTAGRGG